MTMALVSPSRVIAAAIRSVAPFGRENECRSVEREWGGMMDLSRIMPSMVAP